MSRPSGEVPSRTFKAGEVIFKEGDDAKSEAFLVHEGKVEVRKNLGGEDKLLRVLGKGELLGDFALFRNAPRSATALAMAIIKDLVGRMLAAEDRAREADDRAREAEERERKRKDEEDGTP